MWQRVADFLKEKDSFLLTTHVNPEGDAIGSEMALKRFLEGMGKRVVVVNSSPTPANCTFLDPDGEIGVYPDGYDPDIMNRVQGIVIVDVNGWIHLGDFAEELKRHAKPTICIDHHEGVENSFADMVVGDTEAASAGLLVFELIKFMGGEITEYMAEALYTSLVTDTGTFRFTNTDERAFRVAAELCSLGASPFEIHRKVFGNRSWQAAHLIGPVMNTLRSSSGGKVAWIHMTRKMLDETGAKYEDSDGLVDLVRAISGVELCLFFKEIGKGRVKVSLRSNGRVDAYRIARSYGGGGHRMAAGMTIDGELEEVMDRVVGDVEKRSDIVGE